MTGFLATVNVPGFLPDNIDPPTFDTAREAWEYLAGERRNAEDSASEFLGEFPGYSALVNTLESASNGTQADFANAGLDEIDGTGSVVGSGMAYSVTKVEDT